MPKSPISVIIPTLNEEHRLADCIASVSWASEFIVADGGSDDDTLGVARKCGAKVLSHPGLTIGARRNLAIEAAAYEWILALDADERGESGLEQAVETALKTDPRMVFSLRRRNIFEGKEIKWGGWGSDRVVRLFPRSERFEERRVHEKLDSDLSVKRIETGLVHYPYENPGEFEFKLRKYSLWFAADVADSNQSISRWWLPLRPPARFIWMYFFRLGFLDGYRGLKLARMAARSVREKYRKAVQMNRREQPQ